MKIRGWIATDNLRASHTLFLPMHPSLARIWRDGSANTLALPRPESKRGLQWNQSGGDPWFFYRALSGRRCDAMKPSEKSMSDPSPAQPFKLSLLLGANEQVGNWFQRRGSVKMEPNVRSARRRARRHQGQETLTLRGTIWFVRASRLPRQSLLLKNRHKRGILH